MRRIYHKFLNGVELKRCYECKNWLGLASFSKSKSAVDKLQRLCKDCIKQYREINKEALSKHARRKYQANPERKRKQAREWGIANPEKRRALGKKYYTKYRATPEGRLHNGTSKAINRCLKNGKNGNSTFELLGYSVKRLMKHLKSTLPDGYTWGDYMTGRLHLDHKIPISKHNIEKPGDIDFKRCWALKNLRLIPVFDNLSKGNKLEKPFQPSLIFD